ncbi:MAG TPA: hypothetical protein PK079_23390 [Leptospiraceae bacterium]|nr:hypothetical protein [Leptospiraceae bacterium]HMW06529.1 hypothetical protein [Leptospiraceae bacterium]HMX33498.1 hypothetical protein [Leptospiraceae bacterium]HMY32833.1 hypothetical protein [Leptospiraceae bacterium]HMZ65328.1 hypothetical protein [Leptospiraceae bacterium]
MKTKKFDTIAMKRKAQEKISKQTEGLSEKELLEYWNQYTLKNKKLQSPKKKNVSRKK